MNPLEMVVAIVAIVMIAAVVMKRLELGKTQGSDPKLKQENQRLREEMAETRKRLRVLERIVTDRGADTAAQIEALREHDAIENGNEAR